jgi:hypothetical protein
MAKNSDYKDVISNAMELRGQAPAAWENFVMSLRTLSAKQAGALVVSPPDQLVKMQGFAFALHELSQNLGNAPAMFDQYRADALAEQSRKSK